MAVRPPTGPRAAIMTDRQPPRPQAFMSSYGPRLRAFNNSLLTPAAPAPAPGLLSRVTKRGTTIINYAEDGYDDLDDDDDDLRRRPANLRGLRRDDASALTSSGRNPADTLNRLPRNASEPVHVPGVWRDWMTHKRVARTDRQAAAQATLPLTLIPIRIDLDVPAFTPAPAVPFAASTTAAALNPQFRSGEITVPFRLRDIFLWNLHESLLTTEQFAQTLVQDLDLPNQQAIVVDISKQIRTQLEDYAGVALHPLFHTPAIQSSPPLPPPPPLLTGALNGLISHLDSPFAATPAGSVATGAALAAAETDALPPQTRQQQQQQQQQQQLQLQQQQPQQMPPHADAVADAVADQLDPDDAYRCIIALSLNLASFLYTDKFEWSLLHPPGTAEVFAHQTCADLGLAGEWVPTITHAIYEAVLRLKKEACESGGLVAGWNGSHQLPNHAALPAAGAGWRYDPDHLADSWEPKLELLSKENAEKREGDRERQIRRLRRETARFSATAGLLGPVPLFSSHHSLHRPPRPAATAVAAADEERMGRGERAKKKRRFRSLSPLARAATSARATADVVAMTDQDHVSWRCAHCRIRGTNVWAIRDGPAGPRTLCNNCSLVLERDRSLPLSTRNMHQAIDRLA